VSGEIEIPEPDAVEGAPHPRHAARLHGQEAAEAAFLAATAEGRLHHAWLVTGPRGVGKATLAWRIARHLLADDGTAAGGLPGVDVPPARLDMDPQAPLARRVAALGEPRLFLLRRAWDEEKERLKTQITIDEMRRMKAFFSLTAADGGRRVAIVDAADEMNAATANALLKLLEEPPAGAVLLLVAHQPGRLLPTIRSRCRELRCRALGGADLGHVLEELGADVSPGEAGALAELSGGSAGEALRILGQDGLVTYAGLVTLFAAAPGIDRGAAIRLAESVEGREGAARLDLMLYLAEALMARLARAGAAGPPAVEAAPGEAALLARLAPDAAAARRWATLAAEVLPRARQGRAVNLDPAALILDTLLAIDRAVGQRAA